MKRHKFLAILSILAALILLTVTIVPASADGPDQFHYIIDTEGPVPDAENICPFPTWYHLYSRVNEHDFWGETPEDTKIIENSAGWKYTLQPLNGGYSLTFQGSGRVETHFITWDDVIYEINGHGISVTVPGHGVAIAIIGRWFSHCIDDVCTLTGVGLELNDTQTVCNYLLNGK